MHLSPCGGWMYHFDGGGGKGVLTQKYERHGFPFPMPPQGCCAGDLVSVMER